ncbi:MAG: hypothetical protein FJY56_01470 [Betaproteobacteria bacterium]|nr:hypothetical protein [Betaproteobacteria bacterium]
MPLENAAANSALVNPHIYGKAPYHPVNDFAAIGMMAASPSLVTVHPSVPVANIRELLALSKSKPNASNYASAGVGTNPPVAGELFNLMDKVNMIPVHFKGGGPGLIAAMSGEVSVTVYQQRGNLRLRASEKVKGSRGHRAQAHRRVSGLADGR